MLCSRVRKSLYSYASGDAEEPEIFFIKEHLDNCPSCREEYERMSEIKSILSSMGRAVEAPSGLLANIMCSIDLHKYKAIGVYALNNIRSLGASLIAAGLIIAVFSLSPLAGQTFDISIVGRSVAKIQESIIRPFEIINNKVIDISEMMLNLDEAISIEN